MAETANYGLYVTDDSSERFVDWRRKMNGTGSDSNMAKIDAALAGKLDASVSAADAGKALIVGEDGKVITGEAGVAVDTTLTEAGKAADAKTIGDTFSDILTVLDKY